MADTVRVRYAPSPTGAPHLGNIRTALFNWLFARSQGGRFIVRVEDTDQTRLEPGAMEAILDALRWLGIDWDGGPRGGRRLRPLRPSRSDWSCIRPTPSGYWTRATPTTATAQLSGSMPCVRSRRRASSRPATTAAAATSRRPRRVEARAELAVTGREPVVRFKMPLEGQSQVHDLVRGDVQFDLALLDDFVLLKSDGYPTYHLANVVDDHLMEISHVLRAEEWLSSAPRHQELYRALGYPMPVLAHLPLILGPDRAKLSKRHGDTSVLAYRDGGYLPDAMVNFLVLLGWSLDDHTDLISRRELARHFGLERVTASPAVFQRGEARLVQRRLHPPALH